MSNVDWETKTIQAFVVPKKRDRWIEAVLNEKRRKKFIAELSQFGDFDSRWVVQIPPSSQNSEGILAMLQKRGATPTCHAISEFKELDRQEIPLKDALNKIVGYQMGTILCCLPGRLAYFENEEGRFVLERKN